MASELFKVLKADQINPIELEEILISYFKLRTHFENCVLYMLEKNKPALELVYTKRGKLRDVVAKEYLLSDDIDTLARLIDAELIQELSWKIGRKVLFTHRRVAGFFRHGDDFQILPMPENAPKAHPFSHRVPFLLEFRYRESTDPSRQSRLLQTAERQWSAVLNGLSVLPIERPDNQARTAWVVPRGSETSEEMSEWYTYPGMQLILEEFSPTEGIEPICRTPFDTYYKRRGMSSAEPFDLPNDFEESLRFHGLLNTDEKARFDRACYWFQHGLKISSMSNSAAVVAFVTAIEALAPPEISGHLCEKCGHLPGATKTFVDLIETIVPGVKEKDSKFYKARSSLAHGASLRLNELVGIMAGHQGMQEFNQLSELQFTVRAALHNWLIPAARASTEPHYAETFDIADTKDGEHEYSGF